MAGTISSITISPGEKKTIVLQGRKDGWTPSSIDDPNATYTYKVYRGQIPPPEIVGDTEDVYHIETNFSITCNVGELVFAPVDPPDIYYTLNGSSPLQASGEAAEGAQKYEGPFQIEEAIESITIKAAATWLAAEDDTSVYYYPSEEGALTVGIIGQCATPEIVDGEDGSFTITCDYPNEASIYYNIGDGTQDDPTDASTPYAEAVTLEGTRTVKAIAYKAGWAPSEVARQEISIVELEAETIAYLAAMTDGGDATYQAWINSLVANLKTHGLLAKADGIWLLCNKADTEDAIPASFVNLMNPSGTKAAKIGSPVYTTYGGWSANSGANAIDTGMDLGNIGAGAKFARNSATIAVWQNYVRASVYSAGVIDASFNSVNIMVYCAPGDTDKVMVKLNSQLAVKSDADANAGLTTVIRKDETYIDIYRNSTKIGNNIERASLPVPTGKTLYACATNNNGTCTTGGAAVIGFVFVGSALDATEAGYLSTDIAAWIAAKPA